MFMYSIMIPQQQQQQQQKMMKIVYKRDDNKIKNYIILEKHNSIL
jgi:preprotein translocase subunit YajC